MKKFSLLATTLSVAIILPTASALAQTPSPSPSASPAADSTTSSSTDPTSSDNSSLQQMVVTGTYLNGAEAAGSLPVKTITSEQIKQSGAADLSDLLKKIPQNGGGAFTPTVNTGLSFSPGASAIALRGLKEDATLVLVNGMRMPYFPLPQNGTDSFVDINGIPAAAIDHIDVLKEGASSLYGTDAIAGVVNIVLKDGYNGADFDTFYGNTTRNDMSTVRESMVSGYTGDKLSIMVSAEYFHQNSVSTLDRPFSANTDHTNFGLDDFRSAASNYVFLEPNEGYFTVPNGSNKHLTAADLRDGLTADGDFVKKLNTNAYSELIPETERYGFSGGGTYKIVDHISVNANVLYNHTREISQVAPSPIYDTDGVFIPASNPFNPLGEDMPFYYRMLQAGPRITTSETQDYRVSGGVKFDNLPNNWQVELTAMTSESRSVMRGDNFLSVSKTQRALDDTNPDTSLNLFTTRMDNNPSTIEGIKQSTQTTGVTRLSEAIFNAHGDLFDLPAGPVQLAVGSDYYDENYRLQPDQRLLNGDIVGEGGASGYGKRNVKGAYYEISVPIVSEDWNWIGLNELEFHTSGRLDEYTDFGDVYKPKFSLLYKPFKPLSLRASYQEGFRAPSLPELFTSDVHQFDTIVDSSIGQAYDVPITVGGNPGLKPEKSYSYDFGGTLDIPFVKGLSFSGDWWHIDQRDVVAQPTTQFIVDNPGLFPGAISRGSDGRITNVNEVYSNLGHNIVQGVDFGMNYKLPTKFGTFGLGVDGTYNISNRENSAPGTPITEFIGTYQEPRTKLSGSFTYDYKGFEFVTNVYYTGDYGDQTTYIRNVGAWTTVDLQASYEFMKDEAEDGQGDGDGKSIADGKTAKDTAIPQNASGWKKWVKGLKLTVGVNNVADENPPYADATEGYDTVEGDPTGRFYYIELEKKF